MENGVESIDRPPLEEETKTADGGISQLRLADYVVQVFHEPNVIEGDDAFVDNGVESIDRPLLEEETKTADGGISQLKLPDNVVQVFHEPNVSEGDDVFEEAMDGNPQGINAQEHQQKSDLDEAIVNAGESLEKNRDLNLREVNGSPNRDHIVEKFEEAIGIGSPVNHIGEVEQPIVVEEKMELLLAAEPVEVVKVAEEVEDELKDVLPDELNGGVNSNVKDVREVPDVIDDEEKKPLNDIKEDSNGNYDVIFRDKSENGDIDKVKLVEKKVLTNSLDVNNVSLDVSCVSHGNGSSEHIVRQEDQSRELQDTTAYVDTSVSEVNDIPQIKSITTNVGDSVNEEIEAQETINLLQVEDFPTDMDVRVGEAEPNTKGGQNSGSQHVSQNNEDCDSNAVLEEPSGHEKQSAQEIQCSAINDLSGSSMTKEARAEAEVENPSEHGTENERQKLDPEIKELDESSMAEEETKSLTLVKDPEEKGTEIEEEKQDPEIKELGESSIPEEETKSLTLVKDPEEKGIEIEEEKQDPEIKELGESSMAEETKSLTLVKDPEEKGTEIEEEKQDPEIKELGESRMAEEDMKTRSVFEGSSEHGTESEQKKQDCEIKELGESSTGDVEPRTRNVVNHPEEHGKENEKSKYDIEIKDLGKLSIVRGRETQSATDPAPPPHPADPVLPAHPADPVLPARPADPVLPARPADPVLPTRPANPILPTRPADPVLPTRPADPMLPSRPVDPVLPSRPADPILPTRPSGLGSAAPLLEPARAPQLSRVNGAVPQRQAPLVDDTVNGEAEENDETREKLQMIRVKFLRLAHRLGQTPHNVVVAQVLYRLGLAEQLRGRNQGRVGAFSFDRASAMAEQLEGSGQEPLDFSCTIMVLGKSGVGKSATINSIFDEVKFSTDAFQMGTKKVQDVVGTVQGIKVRVIDTPGLLPCWSDQRQNERILHSVKRFIKKNPPDIVLYLDRLDMQTRDFGDMPLLRTITEIFGPSIWFNAIVVLTHAASAPPEGPNGTASSYEMFVTQRTHVVQQAIRQAAGDMRLMNPVSLVENHSACRTNRAGQRVLPNGQVWKPHLLLLSFASKILAEANRLLKLQDNPPGKPFATRSRVPPLPFLLSSLLQSRAQVKLPDEQFGDEDGMDEDLDESTDSDDDSDYDELPPFKSLTKAQLAMLSKAQKKAYFDELEYREKLFMKKQLKEEKKRRKLMKKMEASAKDLPTDYSESNIEEESGGAASVPVAMPDFALPTSFDSDNPTHRYRFLDSTNQWLVRPVLETHGWDHDVGYEGINVERLFVVREKIPLSFSGQVTKDKKESNLQMELAGSVKHGEGKATSLGFDMQTIGKDMAYTLRSDTRFSNFRHNKTAAGLSVTLLGDALAAGVKLEDKLIVNKRFRLVMTGGAMTGRGGDVAYGGSLEATLRDKDYPLGRTLSTLGLSIMDWHGDLAIGCNIQSQIPVGRSTNLVARANLNNRGTGQVSIRLNTSEQLQIALIGLVPLIRKIVGQYRQMVHGE